MRQYLTKMTLALALVGVFYGTCFAAQETGQYPLGSEGVKGATIPPPGVYYRMYTVSYYADKDMDASGNRIPINFNLNVFASVHRVVWVTNQKLFGADYFCDALVPIEYVNIQADTMGTTIADDHANGLGNINVEPFGLAWHQPSYDAAFALSAFAPTGKFNKNNPASPGKDYWTQMTTLGFTWYPDEAKQWSASILSRYEINSQKEHSDVRPGDDFLFEWGISRVICPKWELGIAGYSQWQVTDDKGTAVNGIHDRVHAVGPELNFGDPALGCFVSLRWLKEFGAVDRPEGEIATLTITKCF